MWWGWWWRSYMRMMMTLILMREGGYNRCKKKQAILATPNLQKLQWNFKWNDLDDHHHNVKWSIGRYCHDHHHHRHYDDLDFLALIWLTFTLSGRFVTYWRWICSSSLCHPSIHPTKHLCQTSIFALRV